MNTAAGQSHPAYRRLPRFQIAPTPSVRPHKFLMFLFVAVSIGGLAGSTYPMGGQQQPTGQPHLDWTLDGGQSASLAPFNIYDYPRADSLDPLSSATSISLNGSPTGIAYDPFNGDLYINTPNGLSGNVTVVNPVTSAVVSLIPLPTFSDGSLAVDGVTGFIYVGDYSSTVYSINSSTNQVTGTVPLSSGCSNGCAPDVQVYDRLNGDVYITSVVTNDVYAIHHGSFVTVIPVGVGPYGAAVDTENGEVFVSNEGSSIPSNVTVIGGGTNRVVGEVYGAGGGPGVAYDSATGDVYTCTNGIQAGFQNNVTVVNASTNVVVATILTNTSCGGLAYDPANGYLYVTDEFRIGGSPLSNVTLIDPATNKVVLIEPVGLRPEPIAYDPSNRNMYVGNVYSENLSVLPQVFRLTVGENGLPLGTNWSVTVNQSTFYSTTSSITFPETNGSHAYSVHSVAGFTAYPNSGTVEISGANASLEISFVHTPYFATFNETGLPTGSMWSVSLNGSVQVTANSSLSFYVHNGTYNYSIQSIRNFTVSPIGGSFSVKGSDTAIAVAFSPFTYSAEFAETGLPGGTEWSVTVSGSSRTSTVQALTFALKNGTYNFTVNSPPGYTVVPANGSFTIAGTNRTFDLAFKAVPPKPTWTLLGLTAEDWVVTLVVVVLIAVLASVVWFRRRKVMQLPAASSAAPSASTGDHRPP